MKNATAVTRNKVGMRFSTAESLDEMLNPFTWEPEGLGEVSDFVALVGFGLAVAFVPIGLALGGLLLRELAPDLYGAEELAARLAKTTLRALSSCPNPLVPSNLADVQSKPQVVLLSPPEQEAAAP